MMQTEKQKKLLMSLLVLAVVGILLGLFFMAVLSKSNQELVTQTILDFMGQVKKENMNYSSALVQSVCRNFLEGGLIFFLGMSIIGIPITMFFFFSHAFTLGFSISAIFHVYQWKGIILAIFYILPQLINLGLFLVLCYFSLLFSKYLFYQLFLKKEISFRRIMKRYVKVFGVSFALLVLSSFIEVFLVPKLLLFFL